MSYPPVSVLIPAFNAGPYLKQALISVLQQNYEHGLPIIVLDDGSTDETLAIAKQIAELNPQIRVETQTNHGRVATRNRLLQLASTELVAWLDADDMASPDWILDQVDLILSNGQLAAVSGQGYAMTASGFPIGPIPRPLSHQEISDLHLGGKSNAFFQSCTVARRSLVLEAGGYRCEYPAAEDYDLWLRLSRSGQLSNHPHTHLYYRVHNQSANATQSRQQRDQGFAAANEARGLRGLEPLEKDLQEISPEPKKDNWNRQVYWINVALRSGNPRSALGMTGSALRRHPTSLLLWLMLIVALADTSLFFGNRQPQLQPGTKLNSVGLPQFSFYGLARRLVGNIRRLRGGLPRKNSN
jgi:glycosyltransferase involved in cell wall biosynthesis